MLHVTITEKNGLSRMLSFDDNSIVKIGRVATANIQLRSDSVDKMHAVLERKGNRWQLIDLRTTNGTFVNGRKIDSTPVDGGSKIAIGEFFLTIATVAGSSESTWSNPSDAAPQIDHGLQAKYDTPRGSTGALGSIVAVVLIALVLVGYFLYTR